jgi:benzoyl-CoA reductase/2-hydroxyglutaryl-CoA dehydratase subunit BcrC/BadD/HgdB
MAPTLTAVRERTCNDTLDDEMEMLEVAHTLKGRLADMDNPDMWDDRPLDEYIKDIEERSNKILEKYYGK